MIEAPTHTTPDHVARYYDQNTPRFLRLGGSGDHAAIHRQIWAPGVQDAGQAFLYLNELIARAVSPTIPTSQSTIPHLLDLGCGVGGTATWLAQRLGGKSNWIRVTGVTNSAVQQRMAVERAARLGLARQCQFILADFLELPEIGPFSAAYAIESFIHARQAACFFERAWRWLAPGGRLVICDDFLSERASPAYATPRSLAWVRRFEQGWHLESLLPVANVKKLAEEAGFRLVQATDLTPYLRPFHPLKLGLMKLVTRLPLRSAYWDNLSGGTALQVCIQKGRTEYQALVWEKPLTSLADSLPGGL
jgi:SAM-dependent methyltransferase